MVKRKELKFGEFNVQAFKTKKRADTIKKSLRNKGINTKGFLIGGTHFLGIKGKDLKKLKKAKKRNLL